MTAAFIQIVNDYNHNLRLNHDMMRWNNEMMLEYNRNMRTILSQIPRSPASEYTDIEALLHLLSSATGNNASADVPANGLSLSQVESATDIVVYDSDIHVETRCPISLEDFADGDILCRTKHCNHLFKRSHLMTWLQTHITCPSCRHDLVIIPDPPNSEADNEDASAISRILSSLISDVSGNNVSQYIFEFPIRR
jgi:hypothetical protein